MRKLSPKILITIVLFALLLIPGKYIGRLLRNPVTNVAVEDSDSELLNKLINESKFSRNWWWDLITTHQRYHPQYDPNVNEFAVRSFVGYHKGHDVRFTHTLTRYIALPSVLDSGPMWKPIGVDTLIDQVPMSTRQDSTFLTPNCYTGLDKRERKITRCVLIRERGGIHERIDLDIYGEINTETVSHLVNNVVIVFDDEEVRLE